MVRQHEGRDAASRGSYHVLCALACTLAILGARIWVIRLYANPVPYGDQWTEAFDVLAPYLRGDLSVIDWLRSHNEHRIFFTRATAFAIFRAVGRWEPIIQMLFNAALHAATIGVLVATMGRSLTRGSAGGLALVAATLGAVPYAWENTLWGFQAQFYWLILLGALCVWLMCGTAAFTLRWIAGLLAGLLAYLAMASGALTLLAAAGVAGLQMTAGARRGPREQIGLLVMVLPALICVLDAAQMAHARAPDLGTMAARFAIIAAWPVTAVPLPQPLVAAASVVAQGPLIIALACLVIGRVPISDRRWLCAAVAAWTLAQMAAIAFGRADVPTASRYLDVFMLGILANAACLFALADRAPRAVLAGAAIWLAVIALGAAKSADRLGADLAARNALTSAQAQSVHDHLTTGDPSHLRDVRLYPAPLVEPVIRALADPAIRRILPEAVSGVPETPALRLFKKNVLSAGPALLALGIGLFVLTLVGAGRAGVGPWPRPNGMQADRTGPDGDVADPR
jgi:hypothetical protein